MTLHIHIDVSYFSSPKVRSRVRGHSYLGNKPNSQNINMHNVTILAISRIIKNFMPSVAETGFGGLFYNAREVEFIRTTLDELGQK